MGGISTRSARRNAEVIFFAIGVLIDKGRDFFRKEDLYQSELRPHEIHRTLKRFQKSGYLVAGKPGALKLSVKGKARMKHYALEDIQAPPRPKRWDGKWRLIMFDIPERNSWARNLLRNKIREWNFAHIQRSIFITPFDCEKEISQVLERLELQDAVLLMTVEHAGFLHNLLKKQFRLP